MTHRENRSAEIFEALVRNRPGYVMALLYPNGDGGEGLKRPDCCSDAAIHILYDRVVASYLKNAHFEKGDRR